VKRSSAYLAGVLGFGGMLLLANGSQAQAPAAAPPAAGQPAPAAGARPTVAVFNMAAVMRDYGKAKYQVAMLNKKRNEMSKDLMAWRAEYIKLQQETQNPATAAPVREEKGKRMVDLARQIEDRDREVNKSLNEDATKIISQLYDDIKTVVDKTAEMNGYTLVFAYPDAVTKEEQDSAMVKELKLKPPAASPFYVAKHVDLTGVIIQTLNAWYPSPAVPADAAAPPQPSPAPMGQPQPKQ
jgi:Skp family chaperone for outer membrane proteins